MKFDKILDEKLFKKKENKWSDKEIDQWLTLDDRKLTSQIHSGGAITPMDPLEIRAKHIYKNIDLYFSISFVKYKKLMIKQYGKDAWDMAIKMYDVPSSETEWEENRREYEV